MLTEPKLSHANIVLFKLLKEEFFFNNCSVSCPSYNFPVAFPGISKYEIKIIPYSLTQHISADKGKAFV